jgi:hypothetical protein
MVIYVPDRRRIRCVTVVCVYVNTVLAGRRAMAERAIGERGRPQMGQLALSKGPARMGIRHCVQRPAIPCKGSFSFFLHDKFTYAWMMLHVMYVCSI